MTRTKRTFTRCGCSGRCCSSVESCSTPSPASEGIPQLPLFTLLLSNSVAARLLQEDRSHVDPPTLANPSHRRDAGALLLARAHMLTSQAPDVTSGLVQVRCCDAERLVEVECDQGCTTFSRATCQQRLHSVSPTLAQNFSTVDVSADAFVVLIRLRSYRKRVIQW